MVGEAYYAAQTFGGCFLLLDRYFLLTKYYGILPNISRITIKRALTDLVKSRYIAKIDADPAIAYVHI